MLPLISCRRAVDRDLAQGSFESYSLFFPSLIHSSVRFFSCSFPKVKHHDLFNSTFHASRTHSNKCPKIPLQFNSYRYQHATLAIHKQTSLQPLIRTSYQHQYIQNGQNPHHHRPPRRHSRRRNRKGLPFRSILRLLRKLRHRYARHNEEHLPRPRSQNPTNRRTSWLCL